jgi:hypothetical protein
MSSRPIRQTYRSPELSRDVLATLRLEGLTARQCSISAQRSFDDQNDKCKNVGQPRYGGVVPGASHTATAVGCSVDEDSGVVTSPQTSSAGRFTVLAAAVVPQFDGTA